MRWQKRAIKGNKEKVFIALSAPSQALLSLLNKEVKKQNQII